MTGADCSAGGVGLRTHPVSKQGLFALKTRLVYNAKKASLQCKEAFFSMGRIFAARGEGAPYSRVTKCMVPGTSSKRVPLSLNCTMAVRRGCTCVSL